ncbi:Predicted arabinose efflux permease, MFS family [Rhizobium mongolense subsp. loessense]|uniref:Predicted arabinose efflux permease, MFS family n=1 Tax=Rhizobium mongolense subsp. loessense TaxID=158890 RepID=A0A1G4UBL4_9HYPH|nr:arsenite efflux MFS transporter ArsK [Rhizobium mongolense]SCW91063.1 Predicted arabinose efflux permease, MFS family [Rhizobium mongolense subsp. loessense]
MTEPPPIAAIIALGITQIIGYGTLYYSFSILAPNMSRDLGWPSEAVFGALSAALLIGGLMAPALGKWIDRFGAGRIMTAGSAIAAAALVACALAPGRISFVAALIGIEAASNLVQYGAAFALLVQIRPQAAQRSITYLTLIGGFASTIFWPITSMLHAEMSWRQVYLVFAGLNLIICLPIHAVLSRQMRRNRERSGKATPARRVEGTLAASARRMGFVLMALSFSLQSLVSSAMLVHMVPLLSGLGLGATAALVGTFFGPSQVLSRLTNMLFGVNLPPLKLAIIAATLMSAAVFLLIPTAPSVAGAVAFAVVFGLGNGLFSIVTGTLPLLLFGSDGYGKMQGRVMAARLIVSAVAPFALAYLIGSIGVVWSLALTSAAGALAVLVLVAIGQLARNGSASEAAATQTSN